MAELLSALQRLYSGDASASRELEAFQASPGALELCVELLSSSLPEDGATATKCGRPLRVKDRMKITSI